MNGERTVAWTFLAAATIVTGASLVKGKLPTYREIFGVLGAWLFMAFGAKAYPDGASALSLLVLVAIALNKGTQLMSGATSVFLGTGAKATSKAKAVTAQEGARQRDVTAAKLRRLDAEKGA